MVRTYFIKTTFASHINNGSINGRCVIMTEVAKYNNK